MLSTDLYSRNSADKIQHLIGNRFSTQFGKFGSLALK
jgi:hypothetical protein